MCTHMIIIILNNRSVAVLLWCIRTGHSHGTEAELREWMNDQSSKGDGVATLVKLTIDKIAPATVLPSSSTNSPSASASAATATVTAGSAAAASSSTSTGGRVVTSLYIPDGHHEPNVDYTAQDMLSAIAAAMPAALRHDLPTLQEHADDSYSSSPMRRGLLAELLRTKAIR
jgi:hypothetical protein